MPTSWAARMTCSSSGLPWNRTSGLGSSPLRAASLVPIPAARIRAVLVLDITSLHDLVTLRCFVRWPVIDIADADVGAVEDHCLGEACGLNRVPESTALAVLLDEVNTARPEGWILSRLTLNARDRKILRIDPDAAAKQILVAAPGNGINEVGRPTLHGFGSD